MIIKTMDGPHELTRIQSHTESSSIRKGYEQIDLKSDFVFPRPYEQSLHDILEKGHYISETRKKNSIKNRQDIRKSYRHLLHAVFTGESGKDLIVKIKKAGGLNALLQQKMLVIGKASHVTQHVSLTAYSFFSSRYILMMKFP